MPGSSSGSPTYIGSFLTRYELRAGYDDLRLGADRPRFSDGDAVFYRARMGLDSGLFAVGRGFHVGLRFVPQATGHFGDLGPNTIADARLGLHEGYLRVQGPRVRVDVGRYELVYGDALMIGNNDWNEVGRTFDGVRARIGGGPRTAWLDVFANVVDEGRPAWPRAVDGDLYFAGAYAALGPALPTGYELDLYVLSRHWARTERTSADDAGRYLQASASEFTMGARSKARIGAFEYRVEAGVQAGSRPGAAPAVSGGVAGMERVEHVSVAAFQGDLELGGWWLRDRLRLALEALYASGDEPGDARLRAGWADVFSSAHKWLGRSDAFAQRGMKRTNVASAVLHVNARPLPELTVQLDGHLFARPHAQVVGGEAGFAGGELDLGVSYLLASGLRLRALYGVFLPDGDVYREVLPANVASSLEAAQFFECELRYDLGGSM